MSVQSVLVHIERLHPDDPLGLRVSAGGQPDIGFYLRYRGPEDLIELLLNLVDVQMQEFKDTAKRKTDFKYFSKDEDGKPFILIPFIKPPETTDTPHTLAISAGLQKDGVTYVKYMGPMEDIIQLCRILNSAFKRRNQKLN